MLCNPMQCNVMQYNVLQWYAMQCNKMQCNPIYVNNIHIYGNYMSLPYMSKKRILKECRGPPHTQSQVVAFAHSRWISPGEAEPCNCHCGVTVPAKRWTVLRFTYWRRRATHFWNLKVEAELVGRHAFNSQKRTEPTLIISFDGKTCVKQN